MPVVTLPGTPDLLGLHIADPQRYPFLLQTLGDSGWDILFAFPQASCAQSVSPFFPSLDSRELAVVVGNNPDTAEWANPRVKIIADSGGKEVEGEIVDLADPAATRSIIGTLDPRLYNLDVSRYFL